MKTKMQYIKRNIETEILFSIENFPVTAIIGPRQCGKSTLAKNLNVPNEKFMYLDLERPSHLNRLDNAEWYLGTVKNTLVCIDEIQRKPELFPLLRSLVDEWGDNGKYLILGSASKELINKSTESLAGRIAYFRMTPFLYTEIHDRFFMESYIERGAFPNALLADNAEIAQVWKENYILTFLERDLAFWSGANPSVMKRLWSMLAHHNGQMINYSSIGNSLGISNVTVKNYIDILENSFMLEVLPPYFSNLGKRITKTPKIYLSDSGITLELLKVDDFNQLAGHPSLGSVWEQVVLSNLKGSFRRAEFYYYRSQAGAEVDIVMHYKNKIFAIECKASFAPHLSRGFYSALEDINPDHAYIVIPDNKGYSLNPETDIVSLIELIQHIETFSDRTAES